MIRFKTGVRILFCPATERLIAAAEQAFGEVMGPAFDVVITSANDGQHPGGEKPSRHFDDCALDFRTGLMWDPPLMTSLEARTIRDRMKQILGPDYDVVLEKDHIHGEFDPKGKPSAVSTQPSARKPGGAKAAVVAGLLLLGALSLQLSAVSPARAFLAPEAQGGEEIRQLIRAEILPRFEQCPGLVSGIEAADTFEDQDHPGIRIWLFTIVETVRTPEGLALVEEELTFQAMPGLAPRLIATSEARPWPHE